ncbi:MAG: hypothetical protein ACRDHZ_23105, partial [Ktedonobacteraceae bacterium]
MNLKYRFFSGSETPCAKVIAHLKTTQKAAVFRQHCFATVLHVSLFPFVAAITTPLFAQPSMLSDKTEADLNNYLDLLRLLQEAKFTYSGYVTRSTASKGLMGTWERHGTVSISAKRKSIHYEGSAALIREDTPP